MIVASHSSMTYELTLEMDMIKDQHHEYPAIEQVSETFVVPVD